MKKIALIIIDQHSDREGEISYDITYLWNQKETIQMNLFTKEKQTHRLGEQTSGCQGKGQEEGIVREFGTEVYTWLH